jgi:hypothetical protein
LVASLKHQSARDAEGGADRSEIDLAGSKESKESDSVSHLTPDEKGYCPPSVF